MAVLSDQKRAIVQSVIAAAPDSAIRSLELALAADRSGDGLMGGVRAVVEQEAIDRFVRNVVFSPIAPLCVARRTDAPNFPSQTLAQLWRGLKVLEPEKVQLAALHPTWSKDESPPPVLDMLCLTAAAALRDAHPAFAAISPTVAAGVAACLDLAPLVRMLSGKIDTWINQMTGERAAAARLAYKDAAALGEDYGVRFFQMLAAQLDQPVLILRVISAVMDRPAERYLAASELSSFGDAVLSDTERRIGEIARFDPMAAAKNRDAGDHGEAAGRAVGRTVETALVALAEFEEAVALSKDGPWGRAVSTHKQTLAKLVESRLANLDKLVAAALPLEKPSLGGRRGIPKLDAVSDPAAVARAKGGLAFADAVRSAAANGGFGSARATALEKVNERLNHYTDDLLNYLRDPEAEQGSAARQHLETAAQLVAMSQDERAASLVRRRAAAADVHVGRAAQDGRRS